MNNEIVFVCRSINNKNIRASELNILEKNEKDLYFQFGENPMNIKKRYYQDKKILDEDFKQILEIKEKMKEIENQTVVEEEKEYEKEIEEVLKRIEEETESEEIENEEKNDKEEVKKEIVKRKKRK